jgi:2-oxoglutarate ferredoxin oxidoreductase subunit alpha
MIALSPSSVQESFDLMIEAFNLSEKYRNPVIFLLDGEMGHIREKVYFPDPSAINIYPRNISKEKIDVFGGSRIPPIIEFGQGHKIHVTGSTHKSNGMRDVVSQEAHDTLIRRLNDKIESGRDEISKYELQFTDDMDYLVIAYGTTARPSMGAVLKLREKGYKIGFLRLITIWPFSNTIVRVLGKRVKNIFVPEMNLGQMSREIERFVSCDVHSVSKIGGIPHTINEIVEYIENRIVKK